MGFFDPALVFVQWGGFTVSAGQTTIIVTHGATFTPTRVICFPRDVYAWAGQARVSNITSTTFQVDIDAQQGDAAFDYVAGTN